MTVRLIADACVNWNSMTEAVQMIVEAANAKADFIKFQLFNEETIAESPLKERLKPLILNEAGVKILKDEADRHKIGFILTPMYEEALDLAAKYCEEYVKIRCADHEKVEWIDRLLDKGKKILVSVPKPPLMQDPFFRFRCTYLYCIPKYPPEPEDFNLDAASICGGFSSHYPHTLFDLAFAINRFCEDVFIEKHVMRVIVNHPIDEKVSITFECLADFKKQLDMIERIKRTRI